MVFTMTTFLVKKSQNLSQLGLSVEVFLDQSFYMINKLSKRAGARIVIHDPDSPPLPDEYGLDLRPSTATSASIQKVCSKKPSCLRISEK